MVEMATRMHPFEFADQEFSFGAIMKGTLQPALPDDCPRPLVELMQVPPS